MSMQMTSLLGFALVAIVLTLEGCGGGGQPSSPTPGPPSPAPTPPSPAPAKSYSYGNTTVGLDAGISLSGDSSATISYDVTKDIVSGPALEKLYKEHRDAFTPDVAKLIEVLLDAGGKNFPGPAMSLMMTSLHSESPLSNKGRDFLLALASSDSLTREVELKGEFTVKSSGSMFPQTYYPCFKVLQIDFMNGDTLAKSLMGLNEGDIFTCSPVGTHQDKERMSVSMNQTMIV